MSATIDQKVVEMKFDNRQFETNVSETMSTVGKLKNSLDFEGASKGLEDLGTVAGKTNSKFDFTGASKSLQNVGKAAGDTNISALGEAANAVKVKFSALEVAAITVFSNITNAALDAGRKMANAVIEPMKTGFAEYETQIGAVQTILANTSSKGTSLQEVNAALDELNTYADKTIYNFTEMTKNIGTFTAAGIDLDTSTQAIKGIANMAALSGSNAQQASTAMYQLSQALSTGSVKLMDWNSITNAGMGGEVFKNSLIETAKVHGVEVDKMIKKNGSFRESLQEGWLTSAVLTETLSKFTGDLSDAQLKEMGYTEEQIVSIQKMAVTANDAATKVKTVSQLIDTLKEANQSGWTKSWEILIGDFGEAKELLTEVSNVLGGIIGKSADARNSVLSGGLSTGWKQILDAGIMDEAGYSEAITKVAKANGINMEEFQKNGETFEEGFTIAMRRGIVTSDMMSEALRNMTSETSALSDEQLAEAGYTKEQILKLQELNQGVANGTINMDDFANKIKKESGRENLIDAIWNSFNALIQIMKPVKEAFLEVFPIMTGDQLYELTVKIKKLTEGFKLSEGTVATIKTVFKALFSILDIGKQIVVALFKGFESLWTGLKKIFDSVASVNTGWAEWVINLAAAFKETDIFNKGIQKFVEWILIAATAIKDFTISAIGKIKEFFALLQTKFNIPQFETIEAFMIRVKARMEILGLEATSMKDTFVTAITLMGETIKNSAFWKFLCGVVDQLVVIGKKVGEMAGQLGTMIKEGLSNASFSSAGDAINTGIGAGIVAAIGIFMTNLTKPLAAFGSTFDKITEVLDSIRGCFAAYQQTLKAEVLMKIALAIAILTASILVLSLIDSDRLTYASIAIATLFGELVIAVDQFTKAGAGLKSSIAASALMLSMSTSVLLLAGAMAIIAAIPSQQIALAMMAITALLGEMYILIKVLSDNEKSVGKGMGSLMLVAVAIKVLASAVADLGALPIPQLVAGVAAVVVIMASMIAFIEFAKTAKDDSSNVLAASVGLLIIAAAMKVFASAVSDFGKLPEAEFKQGLMAIIAIITVVGVFTKLTEKSENSLKIGLMMLAIATGISIMAEAVAKLGGIPLTQMIQGLIGIGVIVAGIFAFIKFLPKETNFMGIAIMMLAISAALYIIAQAISVVGKLGIDQMLVGIVGLSAMIAILVIALNAMEGTVLGSAALVIASVALLAIAGALKIVGSMSIDQIKISLLGIAASLLILLVAGAAAIVIAPGLLILAASFGLLGIGVMGLGIGLSFLATGIAALVVAGPAGADAMVYMVTTLLNLIPLAAQKIVDGILSFANALMAGLPELIVAATALIMGILTAIDTVIPKAVETMVAFVMALLDAIQTMVPKMIETAFVLINALLQGIKDNIQGIVEAGIDIVLNIVKGITNKLPAIIDAAFKLVISFINGLADAIDNNHDAIYNAVEKLIDSMINAFTDFVKKFEPIGKNIVDGIIQGIKDKATDVKDAIVGVGTTLVNGLKNALGIKSPSRVFAEIGKYSIMGLTGGLEKYSSTASDAAANVGTSATAAMADSMSKISNLVDGDVDMTPVIRPVLDLTDVESKSKGLDSMFNSRAIDINATQNQAAAANQAMNGQTVNAGQLEMASSIDDLKSMFKTALDGIKGAIPKIEFNGEYSFKDQTDIDYFMNQAALLVDRRAG